MTERIVHAQAHADTDLIPARMCNEVVYCPRLFHLEHVQGVFIHSADTIEGAAQHERAKRRGTKFRIAEQGVPEARDVDELFQQLPHRLAIASESLGVKGEIDLVELVDGKVCVVEAKRGKAPRQDVQQWQDHSLPYAAWPADLAQLGIYMALVRELGLPCDEGRLVYRASRSRCVVTFTPELERFVHDVIRTAEHVAQQTLAPEPLIDSPKCPRCSLHDICLPDEHHALKAEQADRARPVGVRKIVTSCDERSVVHVLRPGTVVRKDGDALLVEPREGEHERFLLKDVSHLALFGPCHVTEPCTQHLLREGVCISHHTASGHLLGMTTPLATRNIGLRRAQFRVADDPAQCLAIARPLVIAKIRNQRTVLRRHRRGLALITEDPAPEDPPEMEDPAEEEAEADSRSSQSAIGQALRQMQNAARVAERAQDLDILRGHEGDAAASYFDVFPVLLPAAWRSDFAGRSRRPPRDRVNAMLSFGYSLLLRDAVAAIGRVGLDPMLGLFHTMIPGRPALALDVMEPFRAAWVDTAILRLIGTKGIEQKDFHVSAAGVQLRDVGRRAVVRAYERRAAEMTTHPRFGYRMSYRRLLELEARILAKVLIGEFATYTPLWTR